MRIRIISAFSLEGSHQFLHLLIEIDDAGLLRFADGLMLRQDTAIVANLVPREIAQFFGTSTGMPHGKQERAEVAVAGSHECLELFASHGPFAGQGLGATHARQRILGQIALFFGPREDAGRNAMSVVARAFIPMLVAVDPTRDVIGLDLGEEHAPVLFSQELGVAAIHTMGVDGEIGFGPRQKFLDEIGEDGTRFSGATGLEAHQFVELGLSDLAILVAFGQRNFFAIERDAPPTGLFAEPNFRWPRHSTLPSGNPETVAGSDQEGLSKRPSLVAASEGYLVHLLVHSIGAV